jgi:hypothetical protein
MFKFIHIHLKIKRLFFIYILYSLSSCTKDKGEFIREINHDSVKIDSCDTIIYTYNQEVRSIINTNCVFCHGASSSNGFLIYYSHVNAYALNGSLVGSLKGQGHPLMPPTGKLSDCDIKGIENWVKAGAKND